MRKNILVTGTHKSGSTWVGRALCASGELRYYHEPFNLFNAKKYRIPMKYWFEYVGTDKERTDTFKKHIDYITLGGFSITIDRIQREGVREAKKVILEELVKVRDRRERKLLKDPIAVFSADFFHEVLDYDVLMIVRHPAAFADSMKTKKWFHDFQNFTAQSELMRDVLKPFREDIEDFMASPHKQSDIIEHSILLWNMIHHRILQYKESYEQWVLVRHEDLSRAPEEEFRRLCNQFDVTFNQAISDYLAKTTQGVGVTGASRDALENLCKWKTRLSGDEIRRLYEGTSKIAANFYDESDWFGKDGMP